MPRVFITGLGFVTSIGNDAATVTRNLRELRHGFELYPPFQKPEIPVKITGTLRELPTDSTDPETGRFPGGNRTSGSRLRPLPRTGLLAHGPWFRPLAERRPTKAKFP